MFHPKLRPVADSKEGRYKTLPPDLKETFVTVQRKNVCTAEQSFLPALQC